ncbi:MAG: hypothetical protein H6710_02345 [Myxococcales bacterium]|nr:hypothetical protein [Myxococcales bacterium]MCB9703912.1 hypothetical protein [Myxococcales bacterium]
MSTDRDAVLRILARERLCIDGAGPGRTTFISHLGSMPRLVPGPWIAHRDLVYALALANLSPDQRRSLAQAVLVDYRREFGVGRLTLHALPSDLPFGGSSLALRPRSGGPRCLYTWALGPEAAAEPCEWLLLRAQPEWAMDAPPLRRESVETLHALDADVVIFVPSAVAARQVADRCLGGLPYTAHPRFLPHLEGTDNDARIALWPHDAVPSASLSRRRVSAAIIVDAPEAIAAAIHAWADEVGGIEVAEAACPGRLDRPGLLRYWEECERPAILLRGDPSWTGPAQAWLRSAGASVELQLESTQLGLF